jgi:hypothetical protein
MSRAGRLKCRLAGVSCRCFENPFFQEKIMPKSDKQKDKPTTPGNSSKKPSVEIEISDEELDKASGGAEFTASLECGPTVPTATIGLTRR